MRQIYSNLSSEGTATLIGWKSRPEQVMTQVGSLVLDVLRSLGMATAIDGDVKERMEQVIREIVTW